MAEPFRFVKAAHADRAGNPQFLKRAPFLHGTVPGNWRSAMKGSELDKQVPDDRKIMESTFGMAAG